MCLRRFCLKLNQKQYYAVKERLEYLYTLAQYGNMREIDELIFQINQNGIDYINDTTFARCKSTG